MVVVEDLIIGSAEVTVEREHKVAFKQEPGAPMFDYMVDIETTGVVPGENAILQIAAVRFNHHTKEIDHNFFDACLTVPTGRYWDEGTRNWWMDKPDVLGPILQRGRDPATVMEEFRDWVFKGSGIQPRNFWGKPITFDFMFIASYFRQFGMGNPFHYRECIDLNSWLKGRGHYNTRGYWKSIEPVGDAHNALNDCLYQIRAVFNADHQS